MLQIIDKVWSKGDGLENEDIAGFHGNFAWVLDGATALVKKPDNPFTPRWLVEEADKVLLSGSKECSSLAGLFSFYQNNFNADDKCKSLAAEEAPSFAMAIIKLDKDFMEYMTFADCYIVLRTPANNIVFLYDEKWAARDIDKPQVRERFYKQTKDEQLAQFIAKRRTMNTPEGYWIGTADGQAFRYNQPEKIPFQKGTEILLCSDGFERAINLFSLYTWEQVFNLPLDKIQEKLRQTENLDHQKQKWSRSKTSDDATAIKLSFK